MGPLQRTRIRRRSRRIRSSAAPFLVLLLLRTAHAQQACDTQLLAQKAQDLLQAHYSPAHGWTVPSAATAPYLESTSSLMAAYATSHFAAGPDQGMRELLASLAGQWPTNGLVPRMRFPAESEGAPWLQGTFFPGPSQWHAPRDGSPAALTSAGLAAPPWHAFVAMQLFNVRRDGLGLSFLAQVFPPLYKYHTYLHNARDAGDHLVYSYHPWESELPTDSPVWAEVLNDTEARIKAEKWAPALDMAAVADVAGYPGDAVFAAELYLVDLLAQVGYNDARIQQTTPFLSVDIEFNAILAAADVALGAMAKLLQLHSSQVVDDTMRSTVGGWANTATSRLEYLWAGNRYASYLVTPQAQPALQNQGPGGLVAPAAKTKAAGRDQAPPPPPRRRHHHKASKSVLTTPSAPAPPPPDVPLPPGDWYPLSTVGNFWPLYVGGLSPTRFEGLLFQVITPGIDTSFDCQGDVWRLPTTACNVDNPAPKVSLLHNFVVQRGLAANGDAGFNRWLLNETLALVCAASMDPFAHPPKVAPAFQFSRYFNPVTGTPVEDYLGPDTTLAAALVWTLLYADAPNGAETPPISHDVTFALVVIELIIAFATGVGCFVFSLSLFRSLSRADSEDDGSVSGMLNVRDEDEHEEGESDEEYDEEAEEGEEESKGLGHKKRPPSPPPPAVRRANSRGLYQTPFRGAGSSKAAGGGGTEIRRSESETSGGGLLGSVGAAVRYFKFW